VLRWALSAPDNVRRLSIFAVHIIKADPTIVARVLESVGYLLERRRPIPAFETILLSSDSSCFVTREHIAHCKIRCLGGSKKPRKGHFSDFGVSG